MKLNELTSTIIGAAIKVHRTLGPGLLESAYRECVAYELTKLGLRVEKEKPIPDCKQLPRRINGGRR